MEPVLFYYSTDGTATFGPVTEDALRQLFKDQVIGAASYICPQGETEWKPIDLAWLRRAPSQALRLPCYEPPPYVPTNRAKEREDERLLKLEEKFDEGPQPLLFQWGGIALATLVTAVLSLMQDGIQNIVAGLIGGLLVTGLLPYIVEQYAKTPWRLRVRLVAMVVFATLTFAGQSVFYKVTRWAATIDQMPEVPAVSSPTPVQPPVVRAPAMDNPADVARMTQTTQPVQQEVIDKVQACDAAQKACGNFDPATLTSQADLNTLRDGIKKLITAQSATLAYFQTYDDRCRLLLGNGNFTSAGIERFVVGAHQMNHIDEATALWQLRVKLSRDHLARLDFLNKCWGNWQPKDGQLIFQNQADLDSYNQLTQVLAADIKQGSDLQSQLQAR